MKKLACSLLPIIILFTISCEIGLGSSVDTDPPSLSIDGKIADKVIRDDFALRGTYSDDGVINSLTAVLKRTDNTGDPISLTGTIVENPKKRGTGTWTIDVPAKTNPIKDGTYQADVSITDGLGRTTTQTTIFTIDNTPPIIILTRPSTSLASQSFDTYGQKFTIEGTAAETNNIGRMEIQLYEDEACTILAAEEPIVLTNVPISIEVEAANYDVEQATYIYKGVTQQFNLDVSTSADGKPFYYKLFAYDGAKRYLPEDVTASDEDLKGNRAEYFFLQKDIYEDIGQYYSTTELYAILSNNYTDEDTERAAEAPAVDSVKEDLLDKTKYQRTVGKFILNPKNNPTYTITGRSPLASITKQSFDSDDNELVNGGQLIIEVSPGLDGHLLKEDSIKIYTKRCTFSGDTTSYDTPIEITQYDKKDSGTSYKFITNINREDGFEIGGYYIVYVEGKDVKNNPIVSAGTNPYGFRLVSNGRPPKIDISDPEESTTYTNTKQIFTGSVEVETGTPVVNIYLDEVSEATKVDQITFTEAQGEKKGSVYVYNFTYEDESFDNQTGKRKFLFEADVGGQTSTQSSERTVVYDLKKPTISITKPATAKKFNAEDGTEVAGAFLNGTVEFNVMLNDAGGSNLDTETNKPKWEIFDASNKTTPLASGVIGDTTGETVSVDTTDSKYNGKTIIFRVTAWDTAGNKSTTEEKDSDYTFTIDQTTDIPFICEDTDYGKVKFSLNSVEAYMAQSAEAKFGTVKKGSTLKFKVYEDDGTANITILKKKLTITKNNDGTYTSNWTNDLSAFDEEEAFTEEIDTPKNLVSMNSYSFPSTDADCGYYEYIIIATDKSDKSANPRKTVKGPFIVRITKDEASITVEKDNDYRNENSEFTNTITIIPSDGPYKLYRQVVIPGEEYHDTTFGETDHAEYKLIKDNIPDTTLVHEDKIKISDYAHEQNITVYYKVIDGSSQASASQSVVLKYDNAAFAPEIKAPAEGKTGKQALTETTQISARLRDDRAGVEKVFYKFTHNANPGTEMGTAGGYKGETASNGSFTLDPDFVEGLTAGSNELCEGKWFFHIYTEDGAGNVSTVETREFDIDMKAPVITTTLDSTTISTDAVHNKNTSYTFKFKITETNALDASEPVTISVKNGTTPISYTIKDETTEVSNLTTIVAGKDYTIEIPDADGLYTYTIKVKDFVGKEATVERVVQYDTTPPVAKHEIDTKQKDLYFRIGDYKNDAGDLDVGGKYSGGTYGNALTIQIRGYFNDEGSGINKFYYKTFNNLEVMVDSTKATGSEPVEEGETIYFNSPDVLKNYVIAKNTGTFFPLDEPEEKNVDYNTAAGKATKTIVSNYKTTIKGFQEGKNYLVLVAEDNVGNTAVDYAEIEGVGKFYCYSLNVDITSPSIPTKEDENLFTNIDSTNTDSNVHFYIEGTVSDKPNKPNGSAGLASVVFTRDGGTGSIELKASDLTEPTTEDIAAVPDDSTLKHWKVDVKSLLPSSGTAIISAKVTDNAGYEVSVPVASITVDRLAPEVIINSPAADAMIGATNLIINGSANDGNGAGLSSDKLKVYYTKSESLGTATAAPASTDFGTSIAEKWVELGEVTSGAIWTFTKDTIESVAPDTYNTPLYFMVSAKDKSGTGNVGYSAPRKVTVDRKAPEFVSGKFNGNETTSTDAWINNRTVNLEGSFTDTHSGVAGSGVTSIYYKFYETNNATSQANAVEKVIPTTDGSYNTNIKLDDSITKASFELWAKDSAGNVSDKKTYLIKVDNSAPSLSASYYKKGTDSVAATGNTVYINNQNGSSTSFVLYGNYNDGTNQSGVKALVFKNNGSVFTPTVTYSATAIGDDGTIPADSTYAAYNADSATGYNSWKATFSLNEAAKITVDGEDIAGNKATTVSAIDVSIDNTPPTLKIDSTTGYNKDSAIYIKNSFTVTVSANDKNGIVGATQSTGGKVYYNIEADSANLWASDKSIDISAETGSGTISISSTDVTFANGTTYKLKISTKDTVGNESTAEKEFTVDSINPNQTELKVDNKTATELLSETNKPWFSKDTLKLTGKFTDTGSGVQTVYYKRWLSTGTEPTTAVELSPTFVNEDGGYYKYETNIGGFEKGTNKLKVWATDNVSNSTTPNTYDVQLDVDAPEILEKNANDFDTEYMTNGVTPKQFEFFVKEIHSGLSESNIIVKVGSGTDPLTLGSGELWTDTDETQLLALKAKDTLTTDEQTTKNALEAKSALNLVKIGTKTGDNYSVTVQIGSTAVSGLNGNKPVTVTVQDVAGNKSSTTPIGSLNVDTTKPVVKFSKPAANAKLNKQYDISGSITEKNEIKSITLTATTGTGSSAKTNTYFYKKTPAQGENNTITLNEDKSWEITVDTNTAEWNNSTVSEDWTLTVSVVDEAGNVSESTADSTRSVKVDQNSDRPIIKVSQIPAADGTNYGYVTVKQIFGSIDDDDKTDDKTVNKLWLWQKQAATPNTNPPYAGKNNDQAPTNAPSYNGTTWTNTDGWLEISPDNNSWNLDSDEADGLTTWYWAVADTNNNVFWTGAASQLNRPYIIYKDETVIGANADNTTGLSFKYDTEAPEITDISFLRLATTEKNASTNNAYTSDEIKTYVENYNQNKKEEEKLRWISEDNYVFGKDKALMYIKVSVNETNEMAVWDSDKQIGPMALTGFDNSITINESLYSDPVINGNKYEYYIGPVYLSSYTLDSEAEGYPVVNLNFKALDKAGKSAEKSKPIKVDNKASFTIENVTPNPDTEMSGDFEFLSTKMKDAESKVASIKYYIPKSSETVPANISSAKWEDVTDFSEITFNIDFTDFGLNKLAYKSYTENNVSTVDVGPDYRYYDIGLANGGTKRQGVFNVPIWFKLEDEVGNVGYVDTHRIKYNPNTDRPKVTLEEPKYNEGATFVELGGNIRISGTASDNDDISGVYLQFAVGDDGEFENTKPKVTKVTKTKDSNGQEVIEEEEIDLPVGDYVTIPGTDGADKGVKANNTLSWNYSFNVGNLKDGTIIKVRAKAVDSDVKDELLASAWSDEIKIKVNNERPIFGTLYLKQYQNDGVTEKTSQLLQSNTYINGDWYLEGSVETNSSEYLKSLSIGDYTWNGNDAHNAGSWVTELSGATVQYDSVKKISFKIPIIYGQNDTEWTRTITAVDNNSDDNKNHSEISPVIKIDTQSPSFPDTENGKIKLYQDSYGVAGKPLGDTYVLQNSNGSNFTLAGKVEENGSGFNKLVFYFKRIGNDNKPRVYNPMLSRANDANRTYISDSSTTTDEKPVYIMDDLPVREIPVTRPAGSTDKLQASEIATNANIRTGGLVKIGGSYRTITKKTEDIVTFNPADETGDTTAYFVYGLVVDSQNERALNNGKIDEKDNDGIRENYSGNQDNGYDWNVTFNSAAIPDGPIQIHIVAFDNAGNIGHGYMETRASNNAPRITSVMLGTDLNGNERFDFGSGEFSTFYAQRDSNQNPLTTTGKEIWDLYTNEHMSGNKYWKVKNGLAVIPEFVGGRSDFYYQFSTHDTDGLEEAVKLPYSKTDNAATINSVLNTWKLKKAGENPNIVLTGTLDAATWNYSGENDGGSLTLTSDQIKAAKAAEGATTDDGVKWYRFSFWDSTEDSDPGLNTGSTVLNIKLEQDLVDSTSPEAYIEPFKWEGTGYTKSVSTTVGSGNPTVTASVLDALTATDVLGISTKATTTAGVTTVEKTTITPKNSLYGASKANGHIELQEDIKNITAITSTLGADDPKVSGKITFHGTAFDETRLSSIWFKFDDFTPTDTLEGGDSSKIPATGYSQAAYYNKASASWTLASATIADGWEISVTDKEFSQDGHTVDWYLSIDTSKISSVAGKDKAFTIVALDAAGKKSTIYASGSEDQTKVDDNGTLHKTPYYKVDVVPYITGISTELSEGNKKRPTVLSRSALGVYPVRRGSSVSIEGFNLTGATTGVSIAGTAIDEEDRSATETGGVSVPVGAGISSGVVEVSVNSVSSLNNKTAKSITTGTGNTATTRIVEYNTEPNGQNNDKLTNKRELKIMDVTTTTDITDKRMLDMAVYGTNLNFSAGYGPDNYGIIMNEGTNQRSVSKVRNSFTRYFDGALAINSDGTPFTISACGDSYTAVSAWGDGPSHLALTRGTTEASSYQEYKGANGTSLLYLESNWNGANFNNLDRFKLPDMVVTGSNADTKGYISYYDSTQKIIKFRYFVTNGTKVATNYTALTGGSAPGSAGGTNTIISKESTEGTVNNYTDPTNSQVYTQGYIAISGANANSQYSAVGVTGTTALVSWYDAANGALRMKYNSNPSTSYSGYQEFKAMPMVKKIIGTYKFTYDTRYSLFYTNNSNLGGKSVKINDTYYTLAYQGSANGNYYYKINNYNKTDTLTNIGVYDDAPQFSFDLSVDGGTTNNIIVDCEPITGGDINHEFAYQLNLILSERYGAYVEVDPKSNFVTVRSMQTGSASSISITNIQQGSTTLSSDIYLNTSVVGTGDPWTEVIIDDENAGQYVSTKTDSKGGIHFAYYDTGNGDLKYAYIPDLNGITIDSNTRKITSGVTVVTVDGYQQVGQYVDLALKETTSGTTTSVIPYISYYSMSNADTKRSAKVAKLVSPITYNGSTSNSDSVTNGSDDELFTGAWEAMHIPTNGIPVQYRVNIGVTSSGNVYISYLADRTIEYVKVE